MKPEKTAPSAICGEDTLMSPSWSFSIPQLQFTSLPMKGDKVNTLSVLNRLHLMPGNKTHLSFQYIRTKRLGLQAMVSNTVTTQKIPGFAHCACAHFASVQYSRWWGHKTAASCCFFRLCSDRLCKLFQQQVPGVQLGYKLHSPTCLKEWAPVSPLMHTNCYN